MRRIKKVIGKDHFSAFNWTMDHRTQEFQTEVASLSHQCSTFIADFKDIKTVVPVILEEGLMPNDPVILQMQPVKRALDLSMNIAFCAYFAATEDQREEAQQTLFDYIEEWDLAYVGDGNPINDNPDIMQPYVLKQRMHPEYTCSTLTFDQNRLAIDPTLADNWDADDHRSFFRHVRLIWPDTHIWTNEFIHPRYSAWLKVYFVGKGDRSK